MEYLSIRSFLQLEFFFGILVISSKDDPNFLDTLNRIRGYFDLSSLDEMFFLYFLMLLMFYLQTYIDTIQ